MKVYYLNGFSGLLMILLAVVGVLALAFALPSAFMMVLWNALVFEGFSGPAIGFWQGSILWLIALLLFKLIFKPEISLEFKKVRDPKEVDRQLRNLKKSDSEK